MTLKWGSTTITAVKWGSTTCTAVYWGSTKVWPDQVSIKGTASTWTKWSGDTHGSITDEDDMLKFTLSSANSWYKTISIPAGKTVYLVCSSLTTAPSGGYWRIKDGNTPANTYNEIGRVDITSGVTNSIYCSSETKCIQILPTYSSSAGNQRTTYISDIYYK